MGASVLAGLLAWPWFQRVTAIVLAALTITLFVLNLRRAGERAGRAAAWLETLERDNAVQRKMLEAASRRPFNRDDLLERLRDGGF